MSQRQGQLQPCFRVPDCNYFKSHHFLLSSLWMSILQIGSWAGNSSPQSRWRHLNNLHLNSFVGNTSIDFFRTIYSHVHKHTSAEPCKGSEDYSMQLTYFFINLKRWLCNLCPQQKPIIISGCLLKSMCSQALRVTLQMPQNNNWT